ncbi:MAG TPA: hypothetical protein VH165_34030 [Kofleriaceae bacterium]|nr:hypothetical protein [Kofleriaceae bacterium]
MNYGFLIDLALVGIGLGTIGLFTGLRERRLAMARMRAARVGPPTKSEIGSPQRAVQNARYVIAQNVRLEIVQAMDRARELPANQVTSGYPVGGRLDDVYEMRKKQAVAQPMKS